MRGGWFDRSICPIGVDLGTHSVKLVQLRARDGRYDVIAAGETLLGDDLPDAPAQRHTAITERIRVAFEEGGFVGRRAVSALPVSDVQYKNLRLPMMPPNELPEAIRWEAAERLNLATDDAEIRYYDAGEVRQGEEVRREIILMAAATGVIDGHLQLLLDVGLQPLAIDAAPGALARLLATHQPGKSADDADVLLDVGYHSSKAIIARHGRVIFFKLIDIGGEQFDQAVAERLNISLPDAREMRRRLQVGHGDNDAGHEQRLFGASRRDTIERAMFEAMRPIIGELARELGLCMRYYSVTFRGRRPEQVLLTGGEATEPQMLRVLQDEGNVAAKVLDPFAAFGGNVANLEGCSGALAVAAGLSMRPTTRSQSQRERGAA